MSEQKSASIRITDLSSPQMRAFHMSWISFFLCFFAWFGTAPMMVVIQDELSLSRGQISSIMVASVFLAFLARLFVGVICDLFGPRLTFSALLILAVIPLFGLFLSQSYETFLLSRFFIGAISGAFVITQCHNIKMFHSNVVGSANAVAAGWGSMGASACQVVVPLLFSLLLSFGLSNDLSWRVVMALVALMLFICGVFYYRWTTDLPQGNYKDLGLGIWGAKKTEKWGFLDTLVDHRILILFIIYGASFGVELTVNNIAALYFKDAFGLSLKEAGLIAASFGLLNLFARPLGGALADKIARFHGLKGRVYILSSLLLLEGVMLCFFSQQNLLWRSIAALMVFGLFVQMTQGATFSLVPFVSKKAQGSAAGVVGAGGSFGAILVGVIFQFERINWQQGLFICGLGVIGVSLLGTALRFSQQEAFEAKKEMQEALLIRQKSREG